MIMIMMIINSIDDYWTLLLISIILRYYRWTIMYWLLNSKMQSMWLNTVGETGKLVRTKEVELVGGSHPWRDRSGAYPIGWGELNWGEFEYKPKMGANRK